ncbi:hypothetical protein UF75_1370 [Desulfosporosinus sp. I2]|nr:hypothetical protein UF75_1370 [Desulfosporosinus sp. I2]
MGIALKGNEDEYKMAIDRIIFSHDSPFPTSFLGWGEREISFCRTTE